jgi:membrane protease YdiL (CAAX protease family)
MAIYIEALIIFIALLASIRRQTSFEIWHICASNIPVLALIWFFHFKSKPQNYRELKPKKDDLITFAAAFPGLLIIGFAAAFASKKLSDSSNYILISPSSAQQWIFLAISCLLAAAVEESFFRYYLLSRHADFKLSAFSALVLSTALFSICHIYEGPWGFLNSLLSGALLSFLFLHYKSLYGLILSHTLYNITAYILAANY